MALVSASMGLFLGRLSDRVGGKYLVMSGLFGMAGGLVVVAIQARADLPAWQLTPGLVLMGLGMGFVLVPVNGVAMGYVPAELRGAACGIFFTARRLGAVLGSAAIGVLLQACISANVAAEGLPTHLTRQAAQLADQAMRNGLTQAARETLIPSAAVLVLGTLAAAEMRRAESHEKSRAVTLQVAER
ncbi:MFS transporter [Streptomyces sp. NPDC020794]|uniref:MFS transporter n=2 Tax=unclassified Streptomyces TaxID=2593676 RepID=UPI0037AB1E7D